MNSRSNESFILSPRRKFETQDFGAVPPPSFGHESYMSPIPTKYMTQTSPPSLCRERKRVRRDAFRSNDGRIMPEFFIPDLSHDVYEDIRVPLKLRLRQRLVHPPAVDTEDEVKTNDKKSLSGQEQRSPCPCPCPSFSNLNSNQTAQVSHRYRSSSSSSDKSTESILIGIGLDSTSRPGKIKRRSSSSALTA